MSLNLNFSSLLNVNSSDTEEVLALLDTLLPKREEDLTERCGHFLNDTIVQMDKISNGLMCNTTFDGILCWPPTKAGVEASLPCMSELQGIEYDVSQNATRMCYPEAVWAEKTDYSQCRPIISESDILQVAETGGREALIIYYIGYGLSLVALFIALWIFLYFKDLRCVRNTIHTNLIITYILNDLTWIITATLQSSSSSAMMNKASCYSTIVLTYFIGTNFFWMFVEGLYLYILVVKTFSIELINIHNYLFIGYGLPAIIVLVWAPIKLYFGTRGDGIVSLSCTWQSRDTIDNIFIYPMVIVLVINIFFLGKIMYVLITKLRAATTAESQQYRKAAKALLVLIPLLGVTYMLVIVTPQQRTAKIILTYLQATLISTQGFSVAVLYCFMNAEVQQSVRHHFERWKTVRTLRGGEYPVNPRTTFAFRSNRYGEGVKLYRARHPKEVSRQESIHHHRHGRGSCVSFSTSSSAVGTTSMNGSGKKISSNHNDSSRRTSKTGYTVVRRSEDIMF